MRKDQMNGIGIGDLGNRQPQMTDIVILPMPCKNSQGK